MPERRACIVAVCRETRVLPDDLAFIGEPAARGLCRCSKACRGLFH
jgi:hypothetical protein